MDAKHWDNLAATFESEVMSSLHADKNRALESAIKKYIKKKDHVADFGCGVGGFLPLLSKVAGKISACDFSIKCIDIAKLRFAGMKNIDLFVHDLTKPLKLKCDVAVAANVLISPEPEKLKQMLKTMAATVKKGGYLIVVVPSMESSLFVYQKIMSIRMAGGESAAQAKKYIEGKINSDIISLSDGVVQVGSVPTKHYVGEEFESLLLQFKMETVDRKKLEYDWETELINPPKNLKGPFPFDWMFVAQKK
ncbi:MAG: class I SAM-dependent methyltransferase [Bacteroidetes bacterium]|jgi:predicted TPR repeat methyltransferase|nr:class I SAM-dependent methyltransferase [Bacteroidota bacterium]